MIIDKVSPYWTAEDRRLLAQIREAQDSIAGTFGLMEPDPEALKEWNRLEVEANELIESVEQRYIEASTKETILEDAEEIVNAIEKEDFLEYIAEHVKRLTAAKADGASEKVLSIMRAYSEENHKNCVSFIVFYLRVQLNALNDKEAEDSIIRFAIERAASWYLQEQPEERVSREDFLPPSVSYTKNPSLELSIDKLVTVFFGANAPDPITTIEGQMSLALDDMHQVSYERSGEKEITLFYNYAYDNDVFSRYNLKKKIDSEDFFILSYLYDAYTNDNKLTSLTKLYKEMNGDDPNATQGKNLYNRLVKLVSTTICINDKEVMAAWGEGSKKKNTYKEIVFPLAPIVIGAERYTANGKIVQSSIRILDAPAVLKIGHNINQFTTVPKSLLRVKKKDGKQVRKTERYYRVLQYLIREIARIKSGNREPKILYDTFYRDIGETTTRGRQLSKDLLYIMLEHFRKENWILGYTEEETKSTAKIGVTIKANITKKIPKKKK